MYSVEANSQIMLGAIKYYHSIWYSDYWDFSEDV